jgi:aromatic-L-amino-acid decarboxylase
MFPPMLERLRSACAVPLTPPAPEPVRSAFLRVMAAMQDDYTALADAAVGYDGSREALGALLHEPAPEAGMGLTELLAEVSAKVVHHCRRPAHPRFLAYIPAAPTYAAILGDCLATNANVFAGVWKNGGGAAQVELTVLDWFKQWLGYPREAMGLLTSGGSEANLTALVTAREQLAADERPRAVIYASDQRHWSIDRAVMIAGLHADQVRTLPSDADFRLSLPALRDLVRADQSAGRTPWLVVANAGTTSTGSVDPLAPLADFCAEQGLWLHVDAAYGWPMVLVDEGKDLLADIGRADSITLDPHKWFAQPYEAGCLLVRRGELLVRTFAMRPVYMQDVVPGADEVNFCDLGLALTRRFRALKIWFSIKLLGVGWFRRLIEHGLALADYAQAVLAQAGFEITSPRKLGVVCFRYRNRRTLPPERIDALQQEIAEELAQSGRALVSTTRLNGQSTLRFCFVNWRTTADDVDAVVRWIGEIGQRLEIA